MVTFRYRAWCDRINVANHRENVMRTLLISCVALAALGTAYAQPASMSDQDYTKRVMAAAPPQVVDDATIVRTQNGATQTLKKGNNAWTCMIANDVPMCMDPNAMEWAHAWQSHGPATDKTGFIYMLAGDTGPATQIRTRPRRQRIIIG